MELPTDNMLHSAKLKIPVPRRNHIPRKDLKEKLKEGLEKPITYICSGAGTGKTTLISAFIQESKLKNVGWFSLDPSTANVYSFWQYVVSAAEPFLNNGNLLPFIKTNPAASQIQQLLGSFAALIAEQEECVLVIDDLQYMTDSALINSFDSFLKILPENLHLFLLSRENPPVYLGQFAVSGALLFISTEDMKLSENESMAFLKTTLGMSNSDTELKHLAFYAEGWIGGLQLAAAAKRVGSSMQYGSIATDYLNREIFEALPPEEQNFLICTAPLSYFDAEIASDFIDGCTPMRFRSIIDSLMEKNLFIICIDEEKRIYRYHNILSDFLLKRFDKLPESRKKELLKKAASAFALRGDSAEVLRFLIRAEDYAEVINIALHKSSGTESWSFLDSIPMPLLIEYPDLAFQCFLYNIGTLNIDRCNLLYHALLLKYQGSDLEKVVRFFKLFRIYDVHNAALFSEVLTLSIGQIENLPLQNIMKTMIFLGDAQIFMNEFKYEETEQCIEKAIQYTDDSNLSIKAFCRGMKSQLYEEIGELNESLDCYRTALQLYNASKQFLGLGTNYYIGITGVYMRRMELDTAQKMLDLADSIYKKHHRNVNVIDMTLEYHHAEMEFLCGNPEKGKNLVDAIIKKYAPLNVVNLGRLLMELDCAELLEQSLARQFLQELSVSAEIYRSMLFMRLLEVRILAKNNEKDSAFSKIDEILSICRSSHNRLHLVEGGLIKIYMLTLFPEKENKPQEKADLLRETVNYAWENRLIMPYYLERSTVLPLLKQLASQPKNELSASELAFVSDVIAVCCDKDIENGIDNASSVKENQEGLSSREVEVLRELAEGITNQQIADHLFISLATVKTHVQNIYSKLNVSSRIAAVDAARRKGIL